MNAAEFSHRLARLKAKGRGRRGYQERAVRAFLRECGASYVVASGKVVGYRLSTGEQVCVKDRYPDEESAAIHIRIMAASVANNPHRVPVRAYQCDACKGWHLTSQATARAP